MASEQGTCVRESCTVGPESPKAEEEPDLLFYKITLTKINWGP